MWNLNWLKKLILGLAAETSPGFFTIINDTAPIYTEPNWAMDVGVVTYPKTNTLVVYVTVVIGSIVAVLRYAKLCCMYN